MHYLFSECYNKAIKTKKQFKKVKYNIKYILNATPCFVQIHCNFSSL